MENSSQKNTNTLLIIFGVVGIAIALFEVMINMHSVDESDRPIQIQQIQAPSYPPPVPVPVPPQTPVENINITVGGGNNNRAPRRRQASSPPSINVAPVIQVAGSTQQSLQTGDVAQLVTGGEGYQGDNMAATHLTVDGDVSRSMLLASGGGLSLPSPPATPVEPMTGLVPCYQEEDCMMR